MKYLLYLRQIPLLVTAALILGACASAQQDPAYSNACRTMKLQVEEKQALDAKVRKVAKEAETYRKQGDTASAASADMRLNGLLENQRLLKESLDASSRDCSPTLKDPQPVRDPAAGRPEEPR
jgi:hypothetical protein